MPRTEIQLHKFDRKTFIKGSFKGKYWANEDDFKSLIHKEDYYDIEIYEADIVIEKTNKEEEGEFEEYKIEKRCITPIPKPVNCFYKDKSGNDKLFKLHILDHKITDIDLTDVVKEHKKSFGTITGKIYGYILDEVIRPVEVEIVDPPPGVKICIQNSPTGKRDRKKEGNEIFERIEFFNADCTIFWGDWKLVATTTGPGEFNHKDPWNVLYWILLIIFGIGLIATLKWTGVAIVLTIVAIFWVFSLFSPIKQFLFNWFFRLLYFAGFAIWIIAIFFALFRDHSYVRHQSVWQDDKKETTTIRNTRSDDNKGTTNHTEKTQSDSIISHYRIWQDYKKRNYSGFVEILASNYRNSISHHNKILVPFEETEISFVYNKMVVYDQPMLNRVYNMFDSIKTKNNLSDGALANVIVSCIQDMPYALVLDNGCDPSFYNDDFIRSYLDSNPNGCEGNVLFGVKAPGELIGNLKADCDSRTLFLYTIFSHFGYDVAILNSEYYKHSVLGLNMPSRGVYKSFNNKKYFLWETTAKGMQLGQFPNDMVNMRFWKVAINNN